MRIIVACERSGRVRDAFIGKGHDAVSCDLEPTDAPGPHIVGDALQAVHSRSWDMLIGFPPCTYLSWVGMANWYDPGRAMKRIKAAEFFMQLWESGIGKICLENPRGIMSDIFRPPDMEFHPYFFGDGDMKRTCLWLHNLPPLVYRMQTDLFGEATAAAKPKPLGTFRRKKTGKLKYRHFVDDINAPTFKNPQLRSMTFPAVAAAMAEQWG